LTRKRETQNDCFFRTYGRHKDRSTLLQVIISIQGTIMGVAEPYYLEPGYDKAGDAGEERSRQYNDNLRYQNMRYAMLGTLRHPPAGFEAVVEGHFSAVREPLLLQCAKWIAEAGSADSKEKMRAVTEELKVELAKLPAAAAAAAATKQVAAAAAAETTAAEGGGAGGAAR
jgi:hypothetical protein